MGTHDAKSLHPATSDFRTESRVDPDGRIVLESVSDGFKGITGYTVAELTEHGGWSHLIPPEDMGLAQNMLGKIFSGQTVAGEIRILTKSGEIRWIRIYSQPIWNDSHTRIVRLVSAATDITGSKTAG